MIPSFLTNPAASLLAECMTHEAQLVCAESCTGGLISTALTAVPGSSRALDRGYVTYSNQAKTEALGVSAEAIETYGAVSSQVAVAMAEGALSHSAGDISLAVTGIAGPGGGTDEKPVGRVHVASARRGGETLHRALFLAGNREIIRQQAAAAAMWLALAHLASPEAVTPGAVCDFWFDASVSPNWSRKDPAFDEAIRTRFETVFHLAFSGRLDHWKRTPESALALTIVLDQFPRNMYRDTPLAFTADTLAAAVTRESLAAGHDRALPSERCTFLCMPLMHSEKLEEQEQSVDVFQAFGREENVKYAIAHRDIIARFGRFPHRNAVLGRESTAEETEFLTQPGSSF